MPATSLQALKTSLYWQERAAAETRDFIQRERCLLRAAKLKAEIAALQVSA